MSENIGEKEDRSNYHGIKFIAPKGHLHPAAGYIEKPEQLLLANIKVLGKLSKKGNARLKEVSQNKHLEEDYEGQTMDEIIGDAIIEVGDNFNSYSGGLKGFRSKQIKGINAAPRVGNPYIESSNKRSILDRLRGKNKPDE